MRKGMAETATIMVLLALMANIAGISVALGGFQDVLGMGADSNDGNRIESNIVNPVRSVCVQGTNADERVNAFTLSSKINVTLVSEENDALNEQEIRGILVEESAQLVNSEPIENCAIAFGSAPDDYRVFEEGQPYEITVNNAGTTGDDDMPATEIVVEER